MHAPSALCVVSHGGRSNVPGANGAECAAAGGRKQPFYNVLVDPRNRPGASTYAAQVLVALLTAAALQPNAGLLSIKMSHTDPLSGARWRLVCMCTCAGVQENIEVKIRAEGEDDDSFLIQSPEVVL